MILVLGRGARNLGRRGIGHADHNVKTGSKAFFALGRVDHRHAGDVLGHHHIARIGLGRLRRLAAALVVAARLFGLLAFGGGGLTFFLDQRLTVGCGDLVVIGMDLGKGQKAMAIAAVIHEGGLQRGFDPRDLGQIDVASKLPLVDGLEIKFLDLGSIDHDNPSFLGMRGVDQHFL